jgi:hypothetical protein
MLGSRDITISLNWPEVTERTFLTHKRTDPEHDGAITEEICQK